MFCQQSSKSISCATFRRRLARIHILTLFTLSILALPNHALSQTQPASAPSVPRLIRYAGVTRDLNGTPLTGAVGVTFSLYAEQTGGAALWMETQNVHADAGGHYSILLGSTKPDGLPSELFASEQARWIGVQIEQQAEQARALLVSAPYALKAGDAETLGGLPPSAFLRAISDEARTPGRTPASPGAARAVVAVAGNSRQAQPSSAVTTSGGTAKTIPMFTTATNIQNSILTQTGTVELNAAGTAAAGSAPIIWLKNNAAIQKGATGNAIDIRFSPDKTGAAGTPNAFIRVQENGGGHNGTSLQFGTMPQGASGASERVRITASGLVGIGTSKPASWLEVDSQSNTLNGATANGGDAPNGSMGGGSTGLVANGGNGDLTIDASGNAGPGLVAVGGASTSLSGTGIIASGGFGQMTGEGGPGIVATGGAGESDGPGGIFAGGNFIMNGDGIDATAGSGLAGYFNGNVTVTGAISAGTKDFKIDHPLDPANKYLVHASVESSEMKNIYDGTVTTDAQGNATVRLPSWFEALNSDFRYQLTVIGQFAQAIVSRKVQNNEFAIKTSMPNVEISWQVTGVRHDAYAIANPLVVEEEKDARLRGFFIHPELYGAQPERQIQWARHPRMMKQMQATLQRRKQRQAVKR
jgi:trimeric autotransporter adhesin